MSPERRQVTDPSGLSPQECDLAAGSCASEPEEAGAWPFPFRSRQVAVSPACTRQELRWPVVTWPSGVSGVGRSEPAGWPAAEPDKAAPVPAGSGPGNAAIAYATATNDTTRWTDAARPAAVLGGRTGDHAVIRRTAPGGYAGKSGIITC